jgi:hypothetical protein
VVSIGDQAFQIEKSPEIWFYLLPKNRDDKPLCKSISKKRRGI